MKVLKFKDGTIVKDTKDAKLGRLMVQSISMSIGAHGIFNENKRIGFVTLPKTAIEALGLGVDGVDFNAKMVAAGVEASRIIVKETTTKEHESNQPKQYPANHKTMAGELILDVDGNEIYSSTEVVPLSSTKQDIKIMSANQSALMAQEAASNVEADALAVTTED